MCSEALAGRYGLLLTKSIRLTLLVCPLGRKLHISRLYFGLRLERDSPGLSWTNSDRTTFHFYYDLF